MKHRWNELLENERRFVSWKSQRFDFYHLNGLDLRLVKLFFSTSVLEGTYVTRFVKLVFRNQRKTSSGSNLWQFTFAQPCQLEQSILFSCLRTASEIWIYSKCISSEKQLNRRLNWEFLDYSCTWYEKIRKKFPKTNRIQ